MGVTALMMALYYGKQEIARAIANTREMNPFEATALGDVVQVQMALKRAPVSVDDVSTDGFTMLGFAAFFGHDAIVEILLHSGANPNKKSENSLGVLPLHSALAGDHQSVSRLLIEHETDINASSGAGWTPLHYAAHNGDVETTELLLSKGANITALAEGKTPANLATEGGYDDIAALLSQ